MKPDGIFLSNGPGDPAATGKYAIGIIKTLIKKKYLFLEFVLVIKYLL